MNEENYFLRDPEGDGFVTFATREERDAVVAGIISDCVELGEHPEDLCVGIITGRSACVRVTSRPPESELDENDCDEDGTQWPDGIDDRYDVEIVPTGQPMHILLEEAKILLREKYAPTAEQMRTPGHSMDWHRRVSKWLHKAS